MEETSVDSQYRRPHGDLGRKIGQDMARDHLPENLWTVDLLDPQPADRILEVGFGPGVAVEEILKRAPGAFVAGVDFSETMVRAASERNADAIKAERADLRYGEASQLPFADASFDKAFSIHGLYFWSNPLEVLRELYRVLKPGGLLVLTVLPKDKWGPNPEGSALEYGTPECTPYYGREIEQMLAQAGFTTTRITSDPDPSRPSSYSVLGLKRATA